MKSIWRTLLLFVTSFSALNIHSMDLWYPEFYTEMAIIPPDNEYDPPADQDPVDLTELFKALSQDVEESDTQCPGLITTIKNVWHSQTQNNS